MKSYNSMIPSSYIVQEQVRIILDNINYLAFYFGHQLPDLQPPKENWGKFNEKKVYSHYLEASSNIFHELTLLLGPTCNARCSICYTASIRENRGFSHQLTLRQLEECIIAGVKHGVKIVYIPGLGEPLLDPRLFPLLEFGKSAGVKFLIPTNGIILGDEREAKKTFNHSCEKLIEKCQELPITFLHKVWSIKKEKICETMGINDYPVYRMGSIDIPKSIKHLTDLGFPKDRLAIQTVILPENIHEIKALKATYYDKLGLPFIVENVLKVGGAKNCFTPFEEIIDEIEPFLVRSCIRNHLRLAIDHEGNVINCPSSLETPLFNLFDKVGGSIYGQDILPFLFEDSRWVANKIKCNFFLCPQCSENPS